MMTPPPVNGEAYPIALASEGLSNYLRGGLSFTGAYTDNVLGTVQRSSYQRPKLFYRGRCLTGPERHHDCITY